MPHDSIRSLRLAFKRAFAGYFVALSGPGIADPTEAFGAAEAYLQALRAQLGTEEFLRRLDDETTTSPAKWSRTSVRSGGVEPTGLTLLTSKIGYASASNTAWADSTVPCTLPVG